jgi:sucrose-6-phosphate hydrolase SacC (GH32 family)
MNGGAYPGMPFNQQMSFPCELKLLRTPAGLRLLRTPLLELKQLHSRRHAWNKLDAPTGVRVLTGPRGGVYHIHQEIDAGSANEFGLVVQGARISYNCRDRQLTCLDRAAPLELEKDRLILDILVDRTSLELFANLGRVSFTSCFLPAPEDQEISLFTLAGTTRIKTLQVYELKSVW